MAIPSGNNSNMFSRKSQTKKKKKKTKVNMDNKYVQTILPEGTQNNTELTVK